ncbi:hypothetical protein ADK34_29740 [Streptomyces viridochromogenes]|uniref:Uncharacterized protein n=1 Tax=Streptomyces viridochromogenes TaxID=1938 RepID=A0A0L8JK45_STRVR|nr:hypothetical protein ADK34_29740 [Streptomyces viridochromogenes]
MDAESEAVRDAAAGDDRFDALAPDETAVFVVVIATVGRQRVRSSPGPADQVELVPDTNLVPGGKPASARHA